MRTGIVGGLVALASATSAAAQTVPTVTLDQPDATFAEPFSSIASLRELSSGRVLVADRLEQAVRLIDFESGVARDVGRQGQGPGEYGMPGFLLPIGGDSTVLLDFGNFRGLVIAGDGRVGATVSLRGQDDLPFIPQGADGQGRLYSSAVVRRDPSQGQDGMPLLRWDRGTGVVDTVARLGGGGTGGGLQMVRARGGSASFSGGSGPYAPTDAWAVAPDGWVGVVRASDYQVEWTDPSGRTVTGPVTPYERVRIGKAEQEEWARELTQASMVIRTPQGSRTLRTAEPDIDDQDWPDYKPPFLSRYVYATASGELWVRQSSPAGTHPWVFHVFDRQGHLMRRVVLPPDRRVVGVGNGSLYAVRLDADDLQWLERYRL